LHENRKRNFEIVMLRTHAGTYLLFVKPLVIAHGFLVYGYTPKPAILSELLCILGAEGCAGDVIFRRPVMHFFN
jgi:hypothetical protein